MTRRIASAPLSDDFHKAVVDNIADGVFTVYPAKAGGRDTVATEPKGLA